MSFNKVAKKKKKILLSDVPDVSSSLQHMELLDKKKLQKYF